MSNVMFAVWVAFALGCGTSNASGPGNAGSGGGAASGTTAGSGGAGAGTGAGVGAGGAGAGGAADGGDICPPCVAPPSPGCVGSGPCGCGPYTCPDAGADACPATFDDLFIAGLKSCVNDDDCVVAQYQRDCCGTQSVHGIAERERERFVQCAPDPSGFPACGCASQAPRAEDGRVSEHFDLSDVRARCDGGTCTSYVLTRTCGPDGLICNDGKLCIAYQTTIGPSETLDYACIDNVCAPTLSCTCAQAACDLRADVGRTCTLDFMSDVYCTDPRQ